MGQFTQKLILLLIIIFSIILFAFVSWKLLILWLPFIFAWWISGLLSPLVEFIHRKTKIFKSLITFIVLIIFICVILLGISVLGLTIVNQASALLDKMPEINEILENGIVSLSKNIIEFRSFLPKYLTDNLSIDFAGILQNINFSVSTILASLVGTIAFVPNLLVAIIVTFVASFFMTKDKKMIKEKIRNFFEMGVFKTRIFEIFKKDVLLVLLGYIRAQLILMLLTFTEISIGLLILKVPYAILIAFGIGILDALPVFGTGTVFIPWVIILLFYQNYSLAIGIFIVYLIATLGRQSLEPKIISTQIGVHPLITLIVIYSGIKLLGVAGIIIAPLIGISLIALKKSELLKFHP